MRAPLSLAILALLWMLRPGKPSLPGSLDSRASSFFSSSSCSLA